MANCTNCGTKLKDGVKFCPSCGTSVAGKSAEPAKAAAQTEELQADPKDAEENKGMAVVAYILFFVPLLTGDHKKSPFVKFHTNQGTVLFLVGVAMWIVWSILWAMLRSIYVWRFWGILSTLSWLVWIAILALHIIGIINALNGKMKPLPVIGGFTIIK